MSKYIDADLLRKEIERRIKFHYKDGIRVNTDRIDEDEIILAWLDSLPEQPVEGLEEAAERYNEMMSWAWEAPNYPHKAAFIAGAEWQKAKMMEGAVEGVARPDDCEIWANLIGYGYKFKDGDKVRVIVIKED